MLRLSATYLRRDGDVLATEPAGPLLDVVDRHVAGHGPPGLVVLGPFGSGKTHLCGAVAANVARAQPATVVPLRDVARHGATVEDGLLRVVGPARLAEAREGRRVLLLDGIDEVPTPSGGHPAFFAALIAAVGPRWVVTGRPSHFRTDLAEPVPEQIDVLGDPSVALVCIEPLSMETAEAAVAQLPSGHRLLDTVEGLLEIATSPLLLDAVRAALPFIEPGRPILPWGVFDAWIRRSLSTGPRHEEAMFALEELAWNAFIRHGRSMDVPLFDPGQLDDPRLPASLRRALFVTELDGRHRFGHRSVYEFLLAVHMAPMIRANQGQGPDELSGVRITDAIRQFLLTRTGPMPVEFAGDRVRVPRGNFVSGGDLSPDERDLRIAHLPGDVWVARVPVTNADWQRFLAANPDDRIDANYLPHWGSARRMPVGEGDRPVYGIWPEDADRYAAFVGARVPSADEWEKAVRGLDGKRWPWGDRFGAGRAVTSELGLARPLPVRALGAEGDAFLFQAVGNVFQYTSSAWRGRADRGRVVMGGCYTHPMPTSRASLRLSHKLSGNLKAGLRLVWTT
jgi:formylglycine-generating enzyme required for sulfatase activity